MRISLDWLRQHIDLNKNPEEIADILTSLGLEAEGVEELEAVPGGLKSVVVGHVKKVWQHPNADRLRLTLVDVGDGQDRQIVCGAPNVAEGQKVLVALEGAKLYPVAGEPLVIKKGKIRGEESQGMICAEDELGIGTSHQGIMVLKESAQPGMAAVEYLGLRSDHIFEIGLTPNRSDATNHLGVARDLTAWLRVKENPDATIKKLELFEGDTKIGTDQDFTLSIEDTNLCPRYAGVRLKNVKVQASPEWLQQRILSMGQKPVNNVVDLTNFILFDMGQPLHAFDLKYLKGGVRVKSGFDGRSFKTLDGQERKLRKEDLMICNKEGEPLCMAGILGGMESGVTDQTTEIFLESAHFQASGIRRSSTHHLIQSQAAKIYEKGSDPNICFKALLRAVKLLTELTGCSVEGPFFDHYPAPVLPAQIRLSLDQVCTLSGIDLKDEDLKKVLFALEAEVIDHRDGNYTVSVPTNKPDVQRPADLIEEICRVYGFDHIPIPSKIQISFPKKLGGHFELRRKLGDYLAAKGLRETMNVSLSSSAMLLKTGIWTPEQLVWVNNTSNASLDAMKPSTVLNGLESIQFNQNRQQVNLALFEFAKDYLSFDGKQSELPKLGIWLTGSASEAHWRTGKPATYDFFSIKSLIEEILEFIGLATEISGSGEMASGTGGIFAYGYQWGKLARAGKVSEILTAVFDTKKDVWYAEMDLVALSDMIASRSGGFSEISRFPSASRDLAIVVDESVPFHTVRKLAEKSLGKKLKGLRIFDLYRNQDQLGAGRKSFALSFTFESMDGSLSSQELDKWMDNCIRTLEKELGATLRK